MSFSFLLGYYFKAVLAGNLAFICCVASTIWLVIILKRHATNCNGMSPAHRTKEELPVVVMDHFFHNATPKYFNSCKQSKLVVLIKSVIVLPLFCGCPAGSLAGFFFNH